MNPIKDVIIRGAAALLLALTVPYIAETARAEPKELTDLRKQARRGNVEAQHRLAEVYYAGLGVPVDRGEAVRWWNRAAKKGHPESQFALGIMYAKGRGVPEDDAEAVAWFRRAIEQDHVLAQFTLADAYRNGEGVPKDDGKAAWYRQAADQGYAEAGHRLGHLYDSGEGVSKDAMMAYVWFSLAADQGNEQAQSHLEEAREKMTPGQAVEAEKLLQEFSAKTKE